ncbi:MAG: peptidoglycan bridge formation glycyltransferase FemA/FemB family protein [Patescibacteria group bacterium]|nr:peptidoglycan bridge formation glycyltransferase FemA/FemB family protein [Patescibacteria group bacterium]MDD5121202.1 peptidoglycan bridge formation glycyltransferase FemA/FemB family protein [Patescibacteria group bacterium]MDD5221769.1 peptidoglycan bridge formation glycyltransferase FemA/FemB family protein [Patescibacteria group bacterium]MDD5395879.1 peptidoglycan bridge formation glycyltransferase FemA/FemB family protein [Patescibacteria group bacterium]
MDFKEWDQLVISHQPTQFCQSGAWSEFQKILGRQYFFIKNAAGQALVIKNNLPGGQNYLFSSRGPILKKWSQESFLAMAEDVKKIAQEHNSIFWRVEPPNLLTSEKGWLPNFKIKNLVKSEDLQPPQTIILDLSRSEEELMAKMHQKTRYNIRLAEKHQVEIREGRPEEIEKFITLTHQTSNRNNFHSHPDNYYRKLIDLSKQKFDNFSVKLLLAEYQSQILVANIVVFFGDTATYLHGASSNEHRNLMAPHLLQWETIRMAKHLGFRYYDFWGVDEKKWPGVTRFKKGFSEETVQYPGTYDFIFNPGQYKIYQIIRALNRFRRRLVK